MIGQLTHIIQHCPVCARPARIRPDLIGQQVSCGHCRGQFVVHESNDGQFIATVNGRDDLLERADRLLHDCGEPVCSGAAVAVVRLPDLSWTFGRRVDRFPKGKRDERGDDTLPEGQRLREHRPATALLVEHRDEVFARIATDMAEAGMRVIRAQTAAEALDDHEVCAPVLIVANVDLLDHSGWLLAAKLRLVDPAVPVWMYKPQPSAHHRDMAGFLQVNKLLEYGGDLFRLSDSVRLLLSAANNRPWEQNQDRPQPTPPVKTAEYTAGTTPGLRRCHEILRRRTH